MGALIMPAMSNQGQEQTTCLGLPGDVYLTHTSPISQMQMPYDTPNRLLKIPDQLIGITCNKILGGEGIPAICFDKSCR